MFPTVELGCFLRFEVFFENNLKTMTRFFYKAVKYFTQRKLQSTIKWDFFRFFGKMRVPLYSRPLFKSQKKFDHFGSIFDIFENHLGESFHSIFGQMFFGI